MKRILFTLMVVAVACLLTFTVQSQMGKKHEVQPLYGSFLIDGYDYKNDLGPKGTIFYNEQKNAFKGTYVGLKMPQGRRAIFAWLHDTVNQKSEYLGPVGWLKGDTGGKKRGKFTITVPDKFKGGNFGSYEVIGFTAEKTSFITYEGKTLKVVEKPTEPSGSEIADKLKPAFYLYASLPGSDTQRHFCGHGGDFFFAKDLDKQFCYD